MRVRKTARIKELAFNIQEQLSAERRIEDILQAVYNDTEIEVTKDEFDLVAEILMDHGVVADCQAAEHDGYFYITGLKLEK